MFKLLNKWYALGTNQKLQITGEVQKPLVNLVLSFMVKDHRGRGQAGSQRAPANWLAVQKLVNMCMAGRLSLCGLGRYPSWIWPESRLPDLIASISSSW